MRSVPILVFKVCDSKFVLLISQNLLDIVLKA